MEKIEGVNLKEYIKQSGKPIKGDLGVKWLKEIAEILDRVHSQDIIHRDIKPQNIMLQSDGKLVLIDFGAVTDEGIVGEGTETATATSGTQTATHTAGGTRIFSKGYAAHEQIEGKATKKSDIYSLGRTFVYLLTAKEPNDPMMYDNNNDQINWRQYAQGVSAQFADLIDSMIKRVPSQRPANTQVILQQLQQGGGVAKRGEDIEAQIRISEVEAAAGTSQEITVNRITNVNGKLQQETKQLTVRIPTGTKEGQKMRLQGQGNAGEYGGENGDVYLRISVNAVASVINHSGQQFPNKKNGCTKPLLWGSLGLAGITAALFIINNTLTPTPTPFPTPSQDPPSDYPKPQCGTGSGYRVFIAYTEENLSKVKKEFCQDAFRSDIRSNSDGSEMIQVASFRNSEEAQDFESILRKYFDRVETQIAN
jgi:hypothetical protein